MLLGGARAAQTPPWVEGEEEEEEEEQEEQEEEARSVDCKQERGSRRARVWPQRNTSHTRIQAKVAPELGVKLLLDFLEVENGFVTVGEGVVLNDKR